MSWEAYDETSEGYGGSFSALLLQCSARRRKFMRGFAGYQKTPTPWGWEYYPPPYRFASPSAGPGGIRPTYANARYMGLTTRALSNRGVGCAGSCSCGGTCKGMGQVDLSFLTNTFNIAGYDIPVWIGLAVGIGATALIYNNTKGRRR